MDETAGLQAELDQLKAENAALRKDNEELEQSNIDHELFEMQIRGAVELFNRARTLAAASADVLGVTRSA
jgi:cell division protein FtsB